MVNELWLDVDLSGHELALILAIPVTPVRVTKVGVETGEGFRLKTAGPPPRLLTNSHYNVLTEPELWQLRKDQTALKVSNALDDACVEIPLVGGQQAVEQFLETWAYENVPMVSSWDAVTGGRWQGEGYGPDSSVMTHYTLDMEDLDEVAELFEQELVWLRSRLRNVGAAEIEDDAILDAICLRHFIIDVDDDLTKFIMFNRHLGPEETL